VKLCPGAWHRGLHHAQSAPAEGRETGTEQMGATRPVTSLRVCTAGAEHCLAGQKCRRGIKTSQESCQHRCCRVGVKPDQSREVHGVTG